MAVAACSVIIVKISNIVASVGLSGAISGPSSLEERLTCGRCMLASLRIHHVAELVAVCSSSIGCWSCHLFVLASACYSYWPTQQS